MFQEIILIKDCVLGCSSMLFCCSAPKSLLKGLQFLEVFLVLEAEIAQLVSSELALV